MPSGGKGLVNETGLQHTRGAWKEKADEELSTQVSLLPEAKRGRIFTLYFTQRKNYPINSVQIVNHVRFINCWDHEFLNHAVKDIIH